MDVKEILEQIELRLRCGWPNPMAKQTGDETAAILAYVRELEARAEKAEAANKRLREALTPSAETKAAYMSEVECDAPTELEHYVPWTSIKRTMEMIRNFAAMEATDE